ncbi:hypothetical protein Tco_1075726 [Tanacetum coccineum]
MDVKNIFGEQKFEAKFMRVSAYAVQLVAFVTWLCSECSSRHRDDNRDGDRQRKRSRSRDRSDYDRPRARDRDRYRSRSRNMSLDYHREC